MHSKQVIVMRRDLKMRKGKIAAQAAHASMAVLLKWLPISYLTHKETGWRSLNVTPMVANEHSPFVAWLHGSFTKICVCT